MSMYSQLQSKLPNGEVLLPGTKAYNKAIFIGNLLYRYKTPACVVMAESNADVQVTVQFAKAHHIKLNVKNGGHSYAGYCLNEDGIVLDLSRMKAFVIDQDNMTLTTQAGSIWLDLYEGLAKIDPQLMVLGGQCPTVGVSGFTLGGGLSTFSRQYGLSIDNLLAVKHVDPQGNLLELTNQETSQDRKDLFWALTGGGGGNFGVTTEFKFKIHKLPNPTIVAGELTWNIPQQVNDFRAAMETFNNMDAPKELCIDAFYNYDKEQLQAEMTVIYNGTMQECERVLAPILKYNPQNGLKSMRWIDWEHQEEGFDSDSKVYHHHVSFIMGEKAITPKVNNIILDLLESAPALIANDDPAKPNLKNCHILWDNIGSFTSTIPAEQTAFYWREGVYVMTAMITWQTPNQASQAFEWAQRCKDLLTPFALEGKAAYVNYIDGTLTDWQQAYYGKNYSRLQKIKTQWDPDNFFYFKQSIEPEGIKPNHIWQNWGECVTACPREILNPSTIGEVISIVKQAAKNNHTIRVFGSGHSWSPLAPSKDIMISVKALNRIQIAPDKKTVTVEPGVTVDQLAAYFKKHNVCVPSNVGHGVGEATYGGVISTGCHGSGIGMKSISDYAISFEVIASDGSIRCFDQSNPDMLNAVRLSLGLFGIITSITFAVEPAYNVAVTETKQPLNEALEQLPNIVLKNEYAELSWIPFTDQMVVQKANHTDAAITREGQEPYQSDFQKQLNQINAAAALNTIVNQPEATPQVMQASLELLPMYNYVSNITDYLHNSDWRPILAYKVSDIEVAVSTDPSFSQVRKAVLICQEHVQKWAKAGRYPFNGVLGFRFIRNSDATLSAARGNQYTALIEISSYFKTDLFETFSGELIQALIDQLPGARIHWAKGFQFMPQAKHYIRESFGPQLDEFLKLRNQAGVDPNNLFVNDYLADLFEIKKQ